MFVQYDLCYHPHYRAVFHLLFDLPWALLLLPLNQVEAFCTQQWISFIDPQGPISMCTYKHSYRHCQKAECISALVQRPSAAWVRHQIQSDCDPRAFFLHFLHFVFIYWFNQMCSPLWFFTVSQGNCGRHNTENDKQEYIWTRWVILGHLYDDWLLKSFKTRNEEHFNFQTGSETMCHIIITSFSHSHPAEMCIRVESDKSLVTYISCNVFLIGNVVLSVTELVGPELRCRGLSNQFPLHRARLVLQVWGPVSQQSAFRNK